MDLEIMFTNKCILCGRCNGVHVVMCVLFGPGNHVHVDMCVFFGPGNHVLSKDVYCRNLAIMFMNICLF